jgi:hypothetical protein
LTNGDPEFLVEFPDQRVFRSFVRLELSTREFPQSGEALAFRSFCDQQTPIRVDEGAGDDEDDLQGTLSRRAAAQLR